MDIIVSFVSFFIIFALIHSVLATDYIKNKAEKLLGIYYRFYRMMYNIISIITFIPVYLIWSRYASSTPLVYSVPEFLYPVFILVRLAGIGMFVYAALQIDVLEFIGLKQKNQSTLITKGAYGIVRHPLYTSGIVILLTKMEMSLLDVIAISLISLYLIIGAFIEEQRLLRTFGEEYRRYQKHVPMFIPIKLFTK